MKMAAKTNVCNRSAHFWTEEETEYMLVHLKKLNILKFMDGRKTRNGNLFKKVQERMASAGYMRTSEQIRVRWKHIKQAYLNAKKNSQAGDHATVTGSFPGILDELLGHRPPSQASEALNTGCTPPGSESTSGGVDVFVETMEELMPKTVESSSSSSLSSPESQEYETASTALESERTTTPAFLERVGTPVARRTETRGQRCKERQKSWMEGIRQRQDQESSESASRGEVYSDIQLQPVSLLSQHSCSVMDPRREAFVSYVRASLKDLEEEVYDDLENDIYQIIRSHKQRDKQKKTSQATLQVSSPPGSYASALQSSGQTQQQPPPTVTLLQSRGTLVTSQLGQIKTENDNNVNVYVL
uniref:Pyrroline-5-carboxylate reductase-like n=1 Tax=Iconisemion striatum TaxID=60296 RepID=A0A1A7YT66_9TELE